MLGKWLHEAFLRTISLIYDLISRLSTLMEIRSIGKNLYTDARKWDGKSILKNAIQNARLKRKWRRGEDSKSLWKEYYSEKKNYKVNKF